MRYRPESSTWHVEQAFAVAVIECGMTLRHSPFAGASALEAPHALLADATLTDRQQGFQEPLATLIDRGGSCPPFGPPSSR